MFHRVYLDPTTFVEAVVSVSMCVSFVLCVFVCRSSTEKLLHQLQEALQTSVWALLQPLSALTLKWALPASVRVIIIRAGRFEALSWGWRFKCSFLLPVSRKWVCNGSHHCHSGTSTLLWTQVSSSAGLEKGHSCEGLRFKFSLSKLPLSAGLDSFFCVWAQTRAMSVSLSCSHVSHFSQISSSLVRDGVRVFVQSEQVGVSVCEWISACEAWKQHFLYFKAFLLYFAVKWNSNK